MKRALERLFLKIHRQITFVLLFIVYFLGIGPTSLFFRLSGRGKGTAGHGSTWQDVPPPPTDVKEYLRQF